MANFSLESLNFSEIALKIEIFQEFAWKIEFFE